MYIPSRGVILLGDVIIHEPSSLSPNRMSATREIKMVTMIDCSQRVIKEGMRRENKQREKDTRKGFWRYS